MPSQQQLKIINYNILIPLVTFFTLIVNDSPLNGSLFILNANFMKKKTCFSDFYYANKKYMGVSSLLAPDFKKHKHDWDAEEQAMLKPSSEGPSQYSPKSYTTCPRSRWFYSLGSRGALICSWAQHYIYVARF